MKKECDANGLEYELLMPNSAKDRFERQINGEPMDLAKHLVILKQKRQSATSTTEPTVGAAAPSGDGPVVGAAAPENSGAAPSDGPIVGAPLSAAINSLAGKAAIAGLTPLAPFNTLTAPKVLVTLRERLANITPRPAPPALPSRAPITLPRISITTAAPRKISIPTFAPIAPLIVQPSHLFS